MDSALEILGTAGVCPACSIGSRSEFRWFVGVMNSESSLSSVRVGCFSLSLGSSSEMSVSPSEELSGTVTGRSEGADMCGGGSAGHAMPNLFDEESSTTTASEPSSSTPWPATSAGRRTVGSLVPDMGGGHEEGGTVQQAPKKQKRG